MKRLLFTTLLCPVLGLSISAQNPSSQNNIIFEESQVHISAPELRVFVTPQVADLEMIYPGKPREEFQQFFPIKSLDYVTDSVYMNNLCNRALYCFAQEHNADLIIEPIINTRVTESDTKKVLITITGYPAKYVNFRPLNKSEMDLEMVKIVYPAAYQKIEK